MITQIHLQQGILEEILKFREKYQESDTITTSTSERGDVVKASVVAIINGDEVVIEKTIVDANRGN